MLSNSKYTASNTQIRFAGHYCSYSIYLWFMIVATSTTYVQAQAVLSALKTSHFTLLVQVSSV